MPNGHSHFFFPSNCALSLAALFIVTVLAPSQAFSQDPVPSYTPEQLRENATSFLAVRERKQSLTAEIRIRAAEFKGYVAGALDARTGEFDRKGADPKLSECVRRKPVEVIAHRTAVGITSQPLNRSLPAPANLGISLYLACDDSMWTSAK